MGKRRGNEKEATRSLTKGVKVSPITDSAFKGALSEDLWNYSSGNVQEFTIDLRVFRTMIIPGEEKEHWDLS